MVAVFLEAFIQFVAPPVVVARTLVLRHAHTVRRLDRPDGAPTARAAAPLSAGQVDVLTGAHALHTLDVLQVAAAFLFGSCTGHEDSDEQRNLDCRMRPTSMWKFMAVTFKLFRELCVVPRGTCVTHSKFD